MRKLVMVGALLAVTLLPSPVYAAALDEGEQAVSTPWMAIAESMTRPDDMATNSGKLLDELISQMKADANLAEMEAAYPGLFDAFAEGIRPLLADEVAKSAPRYRAEIAALYSASLTESEARQVAAFLVSPGMERFRKLLLANMVQRKSVADALSAETISQEAIRSDIQSTALNVMFKLDPADYAAITAFYKMPLGQKFAALNPKKLEVDAKWANEISPENEARIEPIMTKVMIDHIRKTDPEMADLVAEELAKPDS